MNSFYHETFDMNKQNPMEIYLHRGNVNYIITEHWHKTLEMDYILDTGAYVWINGEKKYIEPGGMVLINSGDIHAIEAAGEVSGSEDTLHAASMFISYEYIQELCPEIDNITFDLGGNEEKFLELRNIFEEYMKLYFAEKTEYSYLKINALANQILYLLFTYFKCEKNPNMVRNQKYIDRLRKVMDYMEEHYGEPLTMQDVAEHFNVSMEYMAKVFKTYSGNTFKESLNKIRLSKAFYELLETENSMLEIAMHNGFPDVRSFNNTFKKEYGMTPFQYKKERAKSRGAKSKESLMEQPFVRILEDEE